jgi:hypothetical protein
MGTLFNQQVRTNYNFSKSVVLDLVNMIKEISNTCNLSEDQVIKIIEIKEIQRYNNLYLENGNIYDEQMSGLGELFESLIEKIENIEIALNDK